MNRSLGTCTVLLSYLNSEPRVARRDEIEDNALGRGNPPIVTGPCQKSQMARPDLRFPGVTHSP